MYALGRGPGAQRWDAVPESVADLGDDYHHQLSYSLNGGDAGAKKATQELECASDFALVFDVPRLPLRHLSWFGSWGDREAHRCCAQIRDTTIQ